MKKLAVLLAATMFTLSVSALSFAEQAKPAEKKEAVVETKAAEGKEDKDAKKETKKDDKKKKKAKKKEAAGC